MVCNLRGGEGTCDLGIRGECGRGLNSAGLSNYSYIFPETFFRTFPPLRACPTLENCYQWEYAIYVTGGEAELTKAVLVKGNNGFLTKKSDYSVDLFLTLLTV